MLNPIKTTDFDAIRLKLASPEEILSWSNGEVTRPETINYRTQKSEKQGLFCEKIFGPAKDWECSCGKYKKIRYKGIVCDKCGVEVTRSIVRRERMGHIELKTPCAHIWFLRGISSKIGLLLNIGMQALEKVVYFASFVVTDVDEDLKASTLEQIKQEYKQKKKQTDSEYSRQVSEVKNKKAKLMQEGKSKDEAEAVVMSELDTLSNIKEERLEKLSSSFSKTQKELKDLKPLLIISENVYQNLSLKYGHIFDADIGAEAIKKLLERIDLKETIKVVEKELETCVDSKKEKLTKRLKLFKSLNANDIRPEWMVLTMIPIIPPDLRPMVALDGGRFAASDLNDLYRRVINRNNRLKQLVELSAPEVIRRNEKRMLQEAVDALIDNSARHSKTVVASTGQKRQLKSLADSLKGKQGRFRQNLLGKRTDYSGRSVIVVNPRLRLEQCGLPKVMAIELFKPFIISKLIDKEIVHNVRSASRFIEAGAGEVWDILEDIIKDAYVLLNRAPTLHRLGIQAFRPTLIEGKAIQIHPLVCKAFNADFDGDQMAVHVPLTKEARAEARDLMLSTHNLLKPATGDPIVAPDQDIVWGANYLTDVENEDEKLEDKDLKCFATPEEAKFAYGSKIISLHKAIMARVDGKLVRTTVGRIIFNEIIPSKLGFINERIKIGKLKELIKTCLRKYGEDRTVRFVDELKDRSFEFITKSGLSWGMGDLPELKEKDEAITEATKKIEEVQDQFEEGLLTDSERFSKVIELWTSTKERVTDICKGSLNTGNPIKSMVESGARGSWAQLTQILGMKGLVTSPSGDIIELPVTGNFKRGFGVLEYFISTHGVRKGLSDTALRTANAGYLTRRLVDVAQDVIVTEDDCGDEVGLHITKEGSEQIGEDFYKRLVSRYLAADVKDPKGKVVAKKGELVDEKIAEELKKKDVQEALIRSVLKCKLPKGVCAKCYGYDLGYNKPVKLGTAVGIIAAQSIGEPGTQLTMRTFHTGGIAGQADITQGLPRVEEVFENRPPKKKAILSDVEGEVSIEDEEKTITDENGRSVIVKNPQVKVLKIKYEGDDATKYYFSEAVNEAKLEGKKIGSEKVKVLVKDGDKVSKNTELFKIAGKIVKSKDKGVIKVSEKYVKITKKVDKVKEFSLPKGTGVLVKAGDKVEIGAQLTEGSIELKQLYSLRGRLETQRYIIKEIQYVYSSQGQPLNDKHIEIIARQMFSRHLIEDPKKSNLLPGEVVEEAVLERARKGKDESIKEKRLLLGMIKASLSTDSFLSAASFQQTAQILIEAALSGKIDYLEGLKENVIIGRLIPAGTGYKDKKKRVKY